jgi:ABC-2 type transport system ATP-binding protein
VRFKAEGKTIFLNSHLLSEVELVCDRVAIIELGELRREGNVRDLTRVENVYSLSFDAPYEALIPELTSRTKGVRKVDGGLEVSVEDVSKLNAVLDFIRSKGLNITGMTEKKHTLEQVFLDVVEDGKVA